MKRKDFIKSAAILSTVPFASCGSIVSQQNLIIKKKVKPKRLKEGDLVGLISPGSYITKSMLEEAKTNLESLGLEVTYTDNILKKSGYLGGSDKERAEDVNAMFADKKVKAIVTVRGGYGCARILEMLDYEMIKMNPKILMGYSDITSLLYGLYSKTGLVCFHGPVATSTFNEYSNSHMKSILFDTEENYEMKNPKDKEEQIVVIKDGVGEGELVGGNLSIVVSMVGTEYDVDLKDKILFLEDVGEEPYRIDRMLTQLLQGTNLREAAGIALGVFKNCEIDEDDPEFQNSFTLLQVFQDRLGDLNIPVIYGLSFGHIADKFTLPFGIKAKLDSNNKSLTLLEKSVL
ncbi:MAG: LD-carboxypeptidase [Ignavibacteriae bacterium]|nr:LD-carboxypeptidase [Ignavibacteriota bacterium]